MIHLGPYPCKRCGNYASHGHDVIDAARGGFWCEDCCDEVFGGAAKSAGCDTWSGAPLTEGVKDDSKKLRWSLFPWRALEEILKALEYGAKKYEEDNWRKVDNHRKRYFNAMVRHLVAWWRGEKRDPESGLLHLAHAGACLMFLIERDEE